MRPEIGYSMSRKDMIFSVLAQRSFALGIVGVLIVATIVRWQMVLRAYLLPNSDQAIVGLMARHIVAGERPVFYWGQPYNGTLEAYMTAFLYHLGANGYAALHVAPMLFSLLFVGASMALCNQLYGRRLALLCGLYLSVGPAELIAYSVWPGYNYVQAMGLGTAALVLAVSAVWSQQWWRLIPAAALLGLAVWGQPLALAYVAAVLVLVAGPIVHAWRSARRRASLVLTLAASTAAGLLAMSPMIVSNVQTGWSTVRFMTGRNNVMHIQKLEALRRLVAWAGPVLLGIIPPTEDPNVFHLYVHTHLVLYSIALAILLLGTGYVLWRWKTILDWLRTLGSATPAPEAALTVLAVSLVTAYLFSNWSSSRWSATDPRYLLPLYTLAPLALRALLPPGSLTSLINLRRFGVGLLALVLGTGIAANTVAAPHVDDLRPLAVTLQANGIRAVYGDYWVVYRLAYVSNERLIPGVMQADLHPGLNRYQPLWDAARQSSHPAWVVLGGSIMADNLDDCLAQWHITGRPVRPGPYIVYAGAGATVRCTNLLVQRTIIRPPSSRNARQAHCNARCDGGIISDQSYVRPNAFALSRTAYLIKEIRSYLRPRNAGQCSGCQRSVNRSVHGLGCQGEFSRYRTRYEKAAAEAQRPVQACSLRYTIRVVNATVDAKWRGRYIESRELLSTETDDRYALRLEILES
jgi:hypothetical protein